MLQDIDYDSDSSDDDYVPTEVKDSADEASSGDDCNDNSGLEDKGQNKTKVSKKTKKSKPKGNPLLAYIKPNDEEEECSKNSDLNPNSEDKDNKNREDDVWADFLADVGEEEKKETLPVKSKHKAKSWAELLGKKKPKPTTANSSNDSIVSSNTIQSKTKDSQVPTKKNETVKITKIFEFAGEEVKVVEEVLEDSSEGRAVKDKVTYGGVKRSGLESLVSSLGNKRQKLSTLEKTKLDWQSYKQDEGISEELKLHTKSKDTFIDKQEFLQRADQRQFEIERDMRLGVKRGGR